MTTTRRTDLVNRLETALQQMRRAKFSGAEACQLRPAERYLLTVIGRLEDAGDVTPTEVAGAMGITHAAVTHHLNTLEKSGHIERVMAPDDRRTVHIHLTPAGQTIAAAHRAEFHGLIQYLGEGDVLTLIALLDKISTYIQHTARNAKGN